jgi:phosphoketolase
MYTGSGPGPIPWTALDQYATRYGYDEDIVIYEDFMAYMSALDAEFLKVVGEEIERKQKQAEQKRSR